MASSSKSSGTKWITRPAKRSGGGGRGGSGFLVFRTGGVPSGIFRGRDRNCRVLYPASYFTVLYAQSSQITTELDPTLDATDMKLFARPVN